MNEKKIYSKWVAVELRQLGHKIVRTEVNSHKPELDVWIFESSQKLLDDLTQITQNRK